MARYGPSPAVSVVVPVRDAVATVHEALAGILGQTVADLELVVVDDGSCDGTAGAIRAFTDRRLRLIRHDRPVGLVAALNEGVAAARGGWVARMDADDVAHPRRLERQLAAARSRADCGLVASACEVVDEGGHSLGFRRPPPDHAACRFALHFGNVLSHPTVMYRRELFAAVGGYRPSRFPAEDYDLWIRMARRACIVTTPEVLLTYRRHATGVSGIRRADQEARALEIAIDALEETTGRRPAPAIVAALIGRPPALGCRHFGDAAGLVLATRDAVRRECRTRSIGFGRMDDEVARLLRRSGLRSSSGRPCIRNAVGLGVRHPWLATRVLAQLIEKLRARWSARR
jgi:hypothetical protein